MSLTAKAQIRGAMQLLFNLLDFTMTTTVKVLKTRPSAANRKLPVEATKADPESKSDELFILQRLIFN